MCVKRSERYEKNGDQNHVSLSGTMEGPAKFYFAKGQPRFDFMLRTITSWNTIHKFQIQARGQLAHDIFMHYMEDREVEVRGRLASRNNGRVRIVAGFIEPGIAPRGFSESDILDKAGAIRGAEDEEQESMLEPEEEQKEELYEDVHGDVLTEKAKKSLAEQVVERDERLKASCKRSFDQGMSKGTAAATLYNEEGVIVIEEADEIVDRFYTYFEELRQENIKEAGKEDEGHPAEKGLSEEGEPVL